MIYTVTLNPALDYIVRLSSFESGATNRTDSELMFPGGKGINVSIVLGHLGIKNTALGFVAGYTGSWIEDMLEAAGIVTDFVRLNEGYSRINVKIGGKVKETEINGKGPVVSSDKLSEMLEKTEKLKPGDTIVLSGSIPKGIPEDIYKTILKKLCGRGIRTVVDAEENLLSESLQFSPFLIKPNHIELGGLFGRDIDNAEDAVTYARKLQEKGARNVLVSLSYKGAVFVSEKQDCFTVNAPEGKLVNAVGAGDSMVAGFLAGILKNEDYKDAFCRAVACGTASAYSEELAEKEAADYYYHKIERMVQTR